MGWLRSFGIWRRRSPELLESPKVLLVENFSTSIADFYRSIESELTEREIPELEISRQFFWEGGPISPQREYLRMRRERLIFDVCAAPFGTSFFFSIRFAEIPVVLYLWQLLSVLAVLCGVGAMFWWILGTLWGAVLFGLNVIAGVALLSNLPGLQFNHLDDFLLQVPVFGVVYEVIFRPETFYRIDTRTMYIESVKRVLDRQIDHVTGSKGLKLAEVESEAPHELKRLASVLKPWTK